MTISEDKMGINTFEDEDIYYHFKVDVGVSEVEDLSVADFDEPLEHTSLDPIRKVYLTVLCDTKEAAKMELYLIPDGLDNNYAQEYVYKADDESGDMYHEILSLVKHKF